MPLPQYICELLVGWTLSFGCSQVGLGKQKSLLKSPCINCIPAVMASLLTSTLDKDRMAG